MDASISKTPFVLFVAFVAKIFLREFGGGSRVKNKTRRVQDGQTLNRFRSSPNATCDLVR